MTGVTDLLKSERGVFCVFVVLVALVLTIIGKITGAEWLSFVKWIAIPLVISKTASGVTETIAAPVATAAPTATPS